MDFLGGHGVVIEERTVVNTCYRKRKEQKLTYKRGGR